MIHEMNLNEVYYDKMFNGQKVFEGRLNDEKRRLIKVGDIIKFKKEPERVESFNVLVLDLIYFDSFEGMANSLPLRDIGFEKETAEEVVSVYHQFYTKEDEQKYGVVAIKIKKA